MSDQNFSIMDETVTKICDSLVTEPEKWTFDIYDIVSPANLGRIVIEKGIQDTFMSVRHSRYSVSSESVFSYDQGQKIASAYCKALLITGSRKQQEILKQLNSPIEKPAVTSNPAQLAPRTTTCRLPWYLFAASVFYIILRIKGFL